MPAIGDKPPRIAIVGATGTVGSQIAELIQERAFPHKELRFFGTEGGSDDDADADEEAVEVETLGSPRDLARFDIAFLAAPAAVAEPILKASPGPVLIDVSGARLANEATPLVAPGLTPKSRIGGAQDLRCFSVPHPAAQVIATILSAVECTSEFAAAMVILAAASRGREAISALFQQTADLLNTRLDLDEDETQVAFNLFVPPGAETTAETIANQANILLAKACTPLVQIAHAPAFHGGAVALFVPPSPAMNEWTMKLRDAPGIVLKENEATLSLVDAAVEEGVAVKLTTTATGAKFWCVFDPARIAALAALWVAENLAN